LKKEGKNPFIFDSKEPSIDVEEFLKGEKRYTSLERTFPEKSKQFRSEFPKYVKDRFERYKKMAE